MTTTARTTEPSTVYSRHDELLGTFALRPVDPATDTPLLHQWLTHPKSVYWLMSLATREDVEREFTEIAVAAGRKAFLGHYQGRPEFLVETYDPARSGLGEVYPARSGDVGMHFLIAPAEHSVRGFSRAVLTTVMELLFADPATERVVVEPDVRNTAVHRLNTAVGFRVEDTVWLPDMGKEAYLSTCSRADYHAAIREEGDR